MILEDPLTGDFSSRIEIEEEEEQAIALNLSAQYTTPPQINLSDEFPSKVNHLILLIGSTNVLLQHAIASDNLIGTISVPELQRLRSPLYEEIGVEALHVHHTHKTALLQSLHDTNNVIACSPRVLAPEQAVTWASAVLGALCPRQLFILTSLLAMEYRGPGDPSEEDLVFTLKNNKALSSNGETIANEPPLLPNTTPMSGLPAALLDEAETMRIPATVVVSVENAPIPDAGQVCRLAEKYVLGMVVGKQTSCSQNVKERIRAAVDEKYRSSASNSMFI